MLNLKLKTIADLVKPSDTILDIGTDHGYLPIYLKKNNICKEVYASDIHENALNSAKENFKKENLSIKCFLADGFLGINNNDINTVVIAGMGTSTILSILEHTPKNITKLIISSNNEHEVLRKELYKKGIYIHKEIVIKERNKFYVIDLFTKEKVKENRLTLKFGKSNNIEYYNYLISKEKEILNKIPKNHFLTKLKHHKNIKDLEKIIKRS